MSTEADIMASTFFHTCTVKRYSDVKDGNITRQEYVNVYENIPCAVSTGGGSSANRNDEYQPVEYTDTLYTRPDVEIMAGDEIEATIYGTVETFTAGYGRQYTSHRQTPIIRKGRA